MENPEKSLPGEYTESDKVEHLEAQVQTFRADLEKMERELEVEKGALKKAHEQMRKIEIAGSFERDPAAMAELVRLLGEQVENTEEIVKELKSLIEKTQNAIMEMGSDAPPDNKTLH